MDAEQTDMDGTGTGPLISVVIPTYNRLEYLRFALASVVGQSCQDFEIIIQDNAGDVDPTEVVASFHDPRISYRRNATRVSQTANVTAGCARARGKYLAILSDDDAWYPDFLATLIAPLEADDSLVIAFCDHDIIDPQARRNDAETEKVMRRFQRHRLREGVYRPFDEIALVYRSICTFSAAVIRRAAIEWERLPRDTHFSLDLCLAYLAARTGKGCYYVPRRLTMFRFHPHSVGSSLKRVQQRLVNARDAMRYWEIFLRDGAIPRDKAYYEMKLGFNALIIVISLMRCGAWREALGELWHYHGARLLRPRIVLYQLIYAIRLRRMPA
jgi:glycosyltransferase involved in cell wall biosynthesis